MRIKKIVLNAVIFLGVSCLIVIAVNFFNPWLIARTGASRISPNALLFLEGLLFVCGGFLLLLGRGGISWWTIVAVLGGAARDWLRGEESDDQRVHPSETFRADRWRDRGFAKITFILILSGILMILVYFLNL